MIALLGIVATARAMIWLAPDSQRTSDGDTCKDLRDWSDAYYLLALGAAVVGGLAWGAASLQRDSGYLRLLTFAGVALCAPYVIAVRAFFAPACGWPAQRHVGRLRDVRPSEDRSCATACSSSSRQPGLLLRSAPPRSGGRLQRHRPKRHRRERSDRRNRRAPTATASGQRPGTPAPQCELGRRHASPAAHLPLPTPRMSRHDLADKRPATCQSPGRDRGGGPSMTGHASAPEDRPPVS